LRFFAASSLKCDRPIKPERNLFVTVSRHNRVGCVMRVSFVALVALVASSDVGAIEPSESDMREAFASDLRRGVQQMLAFVEQTQGQQAVRRLHEARTDAFRLGEFRKHDCRQSKDKPGHICEFAVEVDTVAGTIKKSMAGRFHIGPYGLAYDHDG